MGEVYRAHDERLQRDVAIKVLPPSSVGDSAARSRLLREARAAAALNHPHICTVFEVGEESDQAFIAMELVEGQTLDTLIPVGGLSLAQGLKYGVQMADAVAHAHERGILHRDIKAANVMVTPAGRTKVLDFGLAKLTEKQSNDLDVTSGPTVVEDGTALGAVVGTVGYMSPEQVRGGVVDHRSDIFSFGTILYEAATRAKPFVADSSVETMHRILHDKPVPIEERNKEVPAELRRVIRRCLAKNPDQRFQSAKDLAIELREIVDEYDALSASASSGSMTGGGVTPMPARRSPLAIWIAAALVTLAGAGHPPPGHPWRRRHEPAPPACPLRAGADCVRRA
jgi:serine/threonine protein kinase